MEVDNTFNGFIIGITLCTEIQLQISQSTRYSVDVLRI